MAEQPEATGRWQRAQKAIDDLRTELREIETTSPPTEDDTELDVLLRSVDHFSADPVAFLAVDLLYDANAALDQRIRENFSARATEALKRRRALVIERGSIEVTLAKKRRESGVELDQLAEAVGVPADQLAAIEEGFSTARNVTETQLAKWVRHLDVNFARAVQRLTRSLGRPASSVAMGAQRESAVTLSDEDRNFIQRFAEQLGVEANQPPEMDVQDD